MHKPLSPRAQFRLVYGRYRLARRCGPAGGPTLGMLLECGMPVLQAAYGAYAARRGETL